MFIFYAKIKYMKKLVFIAIVIALIIVINNLIHSIYDLSKKQDFVTSAQKELEDEKMLNQKLKAQISIVQSKDFIEEEARNKLFMAKPGEQPVIIPSNLLQEEKEKKPQDKLPNWQKWWDLFFGK
jgi:cell division protein FtsB